MTCPQDFGREGRHSRNADGCVHGPGREFMRLSRVLFGGFRGPLVTGPGTNDQGGRRHGRVDRNRGKRRDDDVVLAQQVEAGQHRTQNGAADIAAIKEAQPGHAARRGLHPPCNRRQRRTHQERRGKQTDGRHNAANQNAAEAVTRPSRIDVTHERHAVKDQDPDEPDPQFEHGINRQGMMTPRNQAGQQQTSQTHSAHEGPQKNSQRNRRGADDQTQ